MEQCQQALLDLREASLWVPALRDSTAAHVSSVIAVVSLDNVADVFGWEKTRRANTEHCPQEHSLARSEYAPLYGADMAASSSLKTPALVACQTLRNRLRNVSLADALPNQLVAKRSVTGLFCYSEDDANTKKRTVGADRFRVEWETLTGRELLDR